MIVFGKKKELAGADAIKKVEEISTEARRLAGPDLRPGVYRIKTWAELDELRLARMRMRSGNP